MSDWDRWANRQMLTREMYRALTPEQRESFNKWGIVIRRDINNSMVRNVYIRGRWVFTRGLRYIVFANWFGKNWIICWARGKLEWMIV